MSWMAGFDARAATWSRPARVAYLVAKWSLIAIGALALGGVWADRLGIWSLY